MKWMTCGAMLMALCLALPRAVAGQPATSSAEFDPLMSLLRDAVESADIDAYVSLLAPEADVEAAREFARDGFHPSVTGAVAQPRFLRPLEGVPEGAGYELTVEVFTERGNQGRLQTWQLDIIRETPAANEPPAWQIADQASIDSVEGLYNLTLSRDKQFDASNLVIAGEDLTLRMTRGSVFVSETDRGITGLVLIGDGVLTFSPQPEAERGQVQIFSGRETLEADFTEAFVRVNPEMFASRVSTGALVETAVGGNLGRAEDVFDEFSGLSFAVDLGDLSDKAWSLSPGVGDFIAEIRTRRYGTLTYAQTRNHPEDVSLYERATQRIIALYPSARKRAVQGRYYSDNDGLSYDVLDYRVEASFRPGGIAQESFRSRPTLRGCFIEGTTRLAVRVSAPAMTTLTLRLADELQVHSVTSNEFGPMLFFRMQEQNNVIIHLPAASPIGTEFTVTVDYSGLLPAQELDENWIGRQRWVFDGESPFGVAERRYVYSNSSYWYPQATASDYATATMDLTVPADYGVVASGEPAEGNPPAWLDPGETGPRRYSFVTLQPARYLAAVISRFVADDITAREVALENEVLESTFVRAGVSYDSVSLAVESNDRTKERVSAFYDKAADILRFYTSLIGDVPYPTFTLALTDSFLPGGHSPAYFAVLNQPMPIHPGLMMSWRTDPVAFSTYPSFFVAHELAHQWWGQAVGWKNYHEQWLSEGLAQYFAALYAEREGGVDVFADVISQMRRWSMRHTAQGPVYLGYRLGRIENEPRVFRALVYNKGAMVLHMLRRLVGDEVFFNGLRRFYNEMRFEKAGTDDLVRAFEIEAGRSLEDFFDRWIHEADVPEIDFSYRTEARLAGQQGETDAVLRFEQGAKLFEVPITVTLRYRSGDDESLVVPVAEQVTEVRVPIRGQLRDVQVNADGAALVDIDR